VSLRLVNKLFLLQVWVAAVVFIFPVLLSIGLSIKDHNFLRDLTAGVIVLYFPFAFLYSLPVFCLSYLMFRFLIRYDLSALQIKTSLCVLFISIVLLYFYILGIGILNWVGLALLLSVVFPSLFFKVYKQPEDIVT
jgi:hypothetical protein